MIILDSEEVILNMRNKFFILIELKFSGGGIKQLLYGRDYCHQLWLKKKEGCLISSELAILPSDVHFLFWKRDINLSQIQLSRFNVIKSIAQWAEELAYRTHKKYVCFLCSQESLMLVLSLPYLTSKVFHFSFTCIAYDNLLRERCYLRSIGPTYIS